MDVAAFVVAVFAMLIAGASLTWQIMNARRARRPYVEVTAWLSPAVGPDRGMDTLDLRVVNRSQHTIRWVGLRVFRKGRRPLLIFGRRRPYIQAYWNVNAPELPLPVDISPHDGVDASVMAGTITAIEDPDESLSLSDPLGITFMFGTGEVMELRPTRYNLRGAYNSRSKRGQPRRTM